MAMGALGVATAAITFVTAAIAAVTVFEEVKEVVVVVSGLWKAVVQDSQ